MGEYTAEIDGGEGGSTVLAADTLAEALWDAEAWAQAGEWRTAGVVHVRVSGPDGEATVGVEVKQSELFA